MSTVLAFITGTSTGIGNSIARQLLNDNEKNLVVGIGRNQSIEAPNYKHIKADFSDPESAEAIAFDDFRQDSFDEVVLINNAGVIEPINHAGDMNNQAVIKHFNINLVAPAVLTNQFVNAFKSFDGVKLIINVSSGAATSPYDGWSCYCSSKAGLEMFAKVVSQEQNINNMGFKLYSVAPGVIDTPMQDTIRSADVDQFSRKEKFVNLKNERLLKDPDKIAENFTYIIYNHDKVHDLIVSF